ncbi:MAG: class I SAM-dependent methyltransferase [Chthoniobacteraceae bacterium]
MRPKVRSHPKQHVCFWVTSAFVREMESAGTDAHRLCSGPQAWLERLGEDGLLSYQTDGARDEILEALPEKLDALGLKLRRVFGKFIPRQNQDRLAPVLITGDSTLPLATTCRESQMRYGLDFGTGYSAGLFIDQRGNRSFLRHLEPRRLLNTFAYTCAFSIVAASMGAETLSIDLSKKSLDRGRDNFRLNDLDPDGHRFWADDVLDMLPKLARRGERFDTIIVDPPTFSRGKSGQAFKAEDSLADLLASAIEVAAPKGRLLLSTNCHRLDIRTLENIAHHALKLTRQSADFHRTAYLIDLPAPHGAKTLWLFLR